MPTPYGAEFRQDVIDVTRKGEAPLAQIAKDFGLSVTTLKRWIAIAERKEFGAGPAAAESSEMRDLKKRNRLLEQENEILRRPQTCCSPSRIPPGPPVHPRHPQRRDQGHSGPALRSRAVPVVHPAATVELAQWPRGLVTMDGS